MIPLPPHEMDMPDVGRWGGAAESRAVPTTCPPGLEKAGEELLCAIRAAFEPKRIVQRGALLHGPRGTGKTALARWVVAQLGCEAVWHSGPMTMKRVFGAFEKNLGLRFEAARRKAPCVLVFDSVECVCPKGKTGQHLRRGAGLKSPSRARVSFVRARGRPLPGTTSTRSGRRRRGRR